MSRLPNDHQRVIVLEELQGRLSDFVFSEGAEYWGWDLIEAVMHIVRKRDARVARLEAALRVYADRDNWFIGLENDHGTTLSSDWVGPGNGPDIARAALEVEP